MSTASDAAEVLRKLVRRAQKEFRDEPSWGVTEMASWLRSGRTERALLVSWMLDASGWYNARGLGRVLDGDADGWADLVAGNRWWLASDHVAAELVVAREHRQAAINPNHLALRATFGVLSGDGSPDAVWGLEMLRRGFTARSDLYVATDSRSLAQALNRVAERDYTDLDGCGVYRAVLEGVRDGRPATREAVVAVCDYHVARVAKKGILSEFSEGPFAVVPVEMEALRRTGCLDGLEPLEKIHPLFEFCPFRIPSRNDPLDELLGTVRARARLPAARTTPQ